MKERPILFSAPMVRALLDGTKTQTRRVVKPQFAADAEPAEMCATNERGHQISGHSGLWWDDCTGDADAAVRCPYGQPGDRLWVREAWRVEGTHTDSYSPQCIESNRSHFGRVDYEASITWNTSMYGKLRPSIDMPRSLSRITLEITGIRVERLQDISEADAMAEGAPPSHPSIDRISREFGFADFPRSWYAQLCDSIHGPGSWDANPWVWVVKFRRITP